MKAALPLLALCIAACGDKAEDTGGSDTDTGEEVATCRVNVTLVSPQDDAEYDVGDTVTLVANGTSTEECGGVLPTITWKTELAPVEPDYEVNGSTDAGESSFLADTEGAYALSVEACVDEVCTEDGPVNFVVGSANNAPDADVNVASTGTVGKSISLDGTGSSDPDGDELSYSWTFYAVPSTSGLADNDIQGAGDVEASFTPDVPGAWSVQLEVSDGQELDGAVANIIVE